MTKQHDLYKTLRVSTSTPLSPFWPMCREEWHKQAQNEVLSIPLFLLNSLTKMHNLLFISLNLNFLVEYIAFSFKIIGHNLYCNNIQLKLELPHNLTNTETDWDVSNVVVGIIKPMFDGTGWILQRKGKEPIKGTCVRPGNQFHARPKICWTLSFGSAI